MRAGFIAAKWEEDMRPNALTKLSAVLSVAALLVCLVFDGSAQARGGDWADRKAKKARWQQSQTDQPPKPTQSGD